MGWAVGEDRDHDRFRGYGVPAYCDVKGCRTEIDRGLGWVCGCWDACTEDCEGLDDCSDLHDNNDALNHPIFVCSQHTCADVDENDLPPEHPDWIEHILTDESWEQWRTENPEKVARFRAAAPSEEVDRG